MSARRALRERRVHPGHPSSKFVSTQSVPGCRSRKRRAKSPAKRLRSRYSPAALRARSSSRCTVPVWFGMCQPRLEHRDRLVGSAGQPQGPPEAVQRVGVIHVVLPGRALRKGLDRLGVQVDGAVVVTRLERLVAVEMKLFGLRAATRAAGLRYAVERRRLLCVGGRSGLFGFLGLRAPPARSPALLLVLRGLRALVGGGHGRRVVPASARADRDGYRHQRNGEQRDDRDPAHVARRRRGAGRVVRQVATGRAFSIRWVMGACQVLPWRLKAPSSRSASSPAVRGRSADPRAMPRADRLGGRPARRGSRRAGRAAARSPPGARSRRRSGRGAPCAR